MTGTLLTGCVAYIGGEASNMGWTLSFISYQRVGELICFGDERGIQVSEVNLRN